jgi:putative ABC transport system permease protein
MPWLLRRLVSDADRRAIETELAELYELRRRTDGDAEAQRWLRRQRRAYSRHLIADRLRGAAGRVAGFFPRFARDAAYHVRTLLRSPGLTATIVLTLGLGLGATTAMLTVVRAVLVSPLPYDESNNLYWLYTDSPPFRFRFSVVDYRALEADHPAFSEVAAFQSSRVTVTEGGTAERVSARSVTGSYFPLMRQTAHLGRLFDPTDDASQEQSAVLTYAYWMRRYAGDPTVLGRIVAIDAQSYRVVGVLERSDGPFERDVAVFTAARWAPPERKGPFFTMVFGRLRPDMPVTAAAETLRATNARLFPIWKSSYQDEKATWNLQDLRSRVVGTAGSTLTLVLAAVGCVLLIACANAVNLLIARSLGRSRELAIRGALGASRGRLLQHLLAETAVLTFGAVIAGVAVAAGAISLVTTYGGTYIPRIDEVRLSAGAFGWLGLLALASGLLIGVVPAVHASRLRMDRALTASSRGASETRPARRVRRALVAAEFALATPLLLAATLVAISLDRLARVDVGVDTSRVLTAAVSLPSGRYPVDTDREAFWKRAVERLKALPGVESVALTDSRPPREAGIRNNFDLEDRPTPPGQNQPVTPWIFVSPEFFRTAGLTLQRGKLLDDRSAAEQEVVVDRAWANRFFPNEEAVGRRLRSGGCTTCPPITVVGVVDNVKWIGLEAAEDGTVYDTFVDWPNGYFMLRAGGDPAALANGLRAAIRELDPELALSNVATGESLVQDALATPRYLSLLVGMFALAALILSIVGIHGVMAHFVQQHTRDLGIRLALGGDPAAVRRMVIRQGVGLVGIGVAVGLGAALLSTPLMSSVLFGVSATDLRALIAIPATLLLVAVLACALPARRAARLDPAQILRES